ncbi:MAG TPA: outer membrane beta-barrel protein [Thermoanaerobaculia bacterium]|jgi:hypothetical protein
MPADVRLGGRAGALRQGTRVKQFIAIVLTLIPAIARGAVWQYGGFTDVGYLYDSNDPSNRLFRSRGTTFHVNEADLNMAALYLKKPASDSSRWGLELTAQTGKDSEIFGFSASAPNVGESDWLTHLGSTNVSYLAPSGLAVQGGIFGSLIGYDSLYAKDNFTYTRPWGADFTPYLMLGVNAAYPMTKTVTGTAFVVNGYWHLAHANDVPSIGGQIAWKPADGKTFKQTILYGPHQSNTDVEFWRFLADSIYELKRDRFTGAFEYFVGTERIDAPGKPRALWMSAQLPVHWSLSPRLSFTLRPEVYWDRDGRTTLYRQTVNANTTTLEYRIPYGRTATILRLEHRLDGSRGRDGGFFKDGTLTPAQNLLIFGVIVSFDSGAGH